MKRRCFPVNAKTDEPHAHHPRGRAAECVETALSAADARCCLVPSGLCVIPAEGLPVSMTLTEEDLLEPPSFNSGGDMILRTGPAGTTGPSLTFRSLCSVT